MRPPSLFVGKEGRKTKKPPYWQETRRSRGVVFVSLPESGQLYVIVFSSVSQVLLAGYHARGLDERIRR